MHLSSGTGSVRRWFVSALRLYPWHSVGLVILSILNSLADGLSISLLIPFVALLFEGAEGASAGGGMLAEIVLVLGKYAGEGRELAAVAGLILVLVAFRCAVRYVEGIIANWISGNISCNIRSRIHDNLLKTDFEYICVTDKGRLFNTLDNEAWNATEAITSFFGLFTSFCMALVFSIILVLISWQLTLMVALLVGFVSLVMLLFGRRMRAISAQLVPAAEDLSERAVELFGAMRIIRAFGREPQAQSAYDIASRRLFSISLRSDKVNGLAVAVQEVLYAINFVIVIFFALWLQLSGAVLIGYLALLHRLQPHVRAIDEARLHLASLSASVLAVSRLLHLPQWKPGAEGALRLARLEDAVRFEGVTFAYTGKNKESRNALEDVTLEFPVGKVIGVVGLSGAGKSTLTNLLFRFYDPDKGSITVDGVPLQRIDLAWWREQLAIAGQDADLVGGTIRDNIAYGKQAATFEEVVDAAKRASVHDFILTLPRGYETQIGSCGVLLSGGQRQRIGLARALLRRSPVLVLDEATNSLDSMTEEDILGSLQELRGQMTIIVIAHRLSTTRTADHVIALAAGRVVETGSPAELLRSDGLYARMVQLQELANLRGESSLPAETPGVHFPP